jgi:hypothetical protein
VFQTPLKNITTEIRCSPLTRVPFKQQHATTERSTAVRLSAGPSVRDTIPTGEPVANGDFANAARESSGGGIKNLNKEETDTLTQEIEIEEILLKQRSSQQQKQQRLGHERNRKGN